MSALVPQGGSQYTDVQRRQAVINYAILGNIRAVADHTGISDRTLYDWRQSDWWDVVLQEVRDEKDNHFDSLFSNIVQQAAEKALEHINTCDKPLDLIKVSAIAFDKLRLLRNLPTSIKADSQQSILNKISDRLRELSEGGRVIEISKD